MPLAALGGRKEVMQRLAPVGDVYQAGTLSGNPVAVAAGMKTVELLIAENPYEKLPIFGKQLAERFQTLETVYLSQLGGVFTPFFGPGPVHNLDDAKRCDTAAHAKFFHGMLDRGFYLPPSQFECAFISAAHTEADIDAFISAAQEVL